MKMKIHEKPDHEKTYYSYEWWLYILSLNPVTSSLEQMSYRCRKKYRSADYILMIFPNGK